MELTSPDDDPYRERRDPPAEPRLGPLLTTFVALFFSLAVLLAGVGLLGSLTALRLEHEGLGAGLIGAVMAAYSAGFVLACLFFGRIIRRVGHIRAFAVLVALAAGSTLIYPLVIDPITWAAMRAVLGFASAGLYMVVESWLNSRTPREVRGGVLAVYSIATYAALGGGQLLLNLWPIDAFQLFNLAALLFALALLPVSLTRAPAPELAQPHPVSVARLYRISPLGMAGACAGGLMSGTFVALGPVFGRQVGLSVAEVATLMAAGMLGGLLLQLPVGWLSDRVSRPLAIVGVSTLVALASSAIVLVGGASATLLATLVLLWGGLAFTIYPLSLAIANDAITPEELVGTGAALLLMNGIGMMLGPVLIGRLMAMFGEAAMFGSMAAMAALLALFGMRRHVVGNQVPVAEQTHFHPVPADATSLTAALDPRLEDPQLELDFGSPEPEPAGEPVAPPE